MRIISIGTLNFLLLIILLASTNFSLWSQIRSGFVTAENCKISYTVFGKGEPILIINGGPGMNSAGFEGLAARLGEEYQAIIFDQRGTGKSGLSSINSNTVNMDLMIEDIELLRKHLKIDSWTILGHSFGGILANLYAAEYPENIEALIHSSSAGIDMNFLPPGGIRASLTETEIDSLDYWSEIDQTDPSEKSAYMYRFYLAKAYLHSDKNVSTIAARLGQANRTINSLIWRELRETGYDLSTELKDFEQPVLIMQGESDILHPDTAIKMKETFKNSKLVLLEKCGHYGWIENPGKYFKNIDLLMKN
ncbi:alpha/beta fold hydrolase [Mangrovivirga cuniculi]|uniref:Alpha/beta hydrolase n=1 Tax=Mangrovivirga cuniculi TaxID=2715131 RepID=A0A4D7JTC3_9BACT|nr:alpha/beta hydrolase [Mangrovivirga cuniculi]QCK16770.1 alpha/beta hydrolase [Mangrovivirga cuniculi]